MRRGAGGALARALPAKTCSFSCTYRLRQFRRWSLRQTGAVQCFCSAAKKKGAGKGAENAGEGAAPSREIHPGPGARQNARPYSLGRPPGAHCGVKRLSAIQRTGAISDWIARVMNGMSRFASVSSGV